METATNFRDQAEKYLLEIANRKRNPARPATLHVYRSILDARILPAIGGEKLEGIGNKTAKMLAGRLAEAQLSPATINLAVTIMKQVLASAQDDEGNQLYPVKWNSDFIDAPAVNPASQKAPIADIKSIQYALRAANGEIRVLVALLAGTGLRIGEALAIGLPDGNVWDQEAGTIQVTSTMTPSGIQKAPKTAAGVRVVDLHPDLNRALKKLDRKAPFVKHEITYRRALEDLGIQGFHSLRRSRITHLQNSNVPPMLIKYWAGHAAGDITERYTKIGSQIKERKDWSKKAGLGFQL